MTEFVEPFCGVDGAFKSSVETIISILDFFSLKTTKTFGYNVVPYYEWRILS